MEVKKIIKIIGKLGLCSPLPPLGTGNAAAMSEDRQRPARAFVHQYMLDALRDPSDPYVIPRQTTQYMALHEFPTMPTTIRAAIHVATQRAANVGLYCPTCDAGLGILLDAYESRVVAFREMRIESYHLAGGMQARASRDVAVAETAGATRGARRTLHGRAYSRMSSAEAMRFEESQRQARRDHNALTILEWDAELWTGVWLRNTLDGYREMRAHGDCISPMARNSAWGVFVAPYTTDFGSCFHRATGNFTIRYNAPFARQPTGTYQLHGPYASDESARRSHEGEDASASISIEWVRHVADADRVQQLAACATQELARRPVRRIVVWDDLACGDTARAIRAQHPSLRVDCVYSTTSDVYTVAAMVAAMGAGGAPPAVVSRRANRHGGQPFELDSAHTLVVLPRRLVPFEIDTFAEYANMAVGAMLPPSPIAHHVARRRLRFPEEMRDCGLNVVGTLQVYRLGYTVPSLVRMAPFLAFSRESAETDETADGTIYHIEEAHPSAFPVVSLAKMREIAHKGDWPSLNARVVASMQASFRGSKLQEKSDFNGKKYRKTCRHVCSDGGGRAHGEGR